MLLLLSVLFGGCFHRSTLGDGAHMYKIMLMKKAQIELTGVSYYTDSEEPGALIEELWEEFRRTPEDIDAISIADGKIQLVDWKLQDGILNLFFSEEYALMDSVTELLFRAGIVRTFQQIEGVDGVRFYVDSLPLCDAAGKILPEMTASDFVDITGQEVNAVQIRNLSLYYANQSGDALVVDSMKVAYSSSASVEEYIMERLIEGPDVEGQFPVLPANTRVNSVDIHENICYIDFDETFLSNSLPVESDVIIFAVVNSLCEMSGVYQVQFSINGNSNVTFRSNIPLNEPFERNLDYIESAQKVIIEEE